LRTDPRCFRLLAVADPVVIELREWSRIAEDLSAERNRLTNRMREQLWRYFPAMLELEDDLGAEWLLDLWETVRTTREAGPSTLRSEVEVTVTAALCDQWPIACSASPAPC
jgi:hypothetical protein